MQTDEVAAVGVRALQPAPFGRRLVALLADVLFQLIPLVLAGLVLRFLLASGLWSPASLQSGATSAQRWHDFELGPRLAVVIAFIVSTGPFYFALCHASPWQATFGKRLANIFVADVEGRRIGIARSIGRWFARFFLAFLFGDFISLVCVAVSRRKRAVHDFLPEPWSCPASRHRCNESSLGGWRPLWQYPSFGSWSRF